MKFDTAHKVHAPKIMKEGSSSRPSERKKWRDRIPAPNTAVMSAGIEKIKLEDKIASKIKTDANAIISAPFAQSGREMFVPFIRVASIEACTSCGAFNPSAVAISVDAPLAVTPIIATIGFVSNFMKSVADIRRN